MAEIVIASRNDGKIEEIKNYSTHLNSRVKWLTYKEVGGFPRVEETGNTFLENAKIKASAISKHTNKMVVADDSGLVVDLLKGEPGIFSSRYAGGDAADQDNRIKLLQQLGDAHSDKRNARFVCSLVLWNPEKGMIFNTSGVCEGRIGYQEKGSGGFGYDPLFIPRGYKKTMAQLSPTEKNKISHRGKALAAFCRFIENF
ncbi:MAG: RdgB/HAM1 family non-canonical purine NTP pyrophosphatase [Actinomycetota bacterium]